MSFTRLSMLNATLAAMPAHDAARALGQLVPHHQRYWIYWRLREDTVPTIASPRS